METHALNYMPINRAMKELGISKYKFYQLVKEGRIKLVKLDRKSFVSVKEINSLFEKYE